MKERFDVQLLLLLSGTEQGKAKEAVTSPAAVVQSLHPPSNRNNDNNARARVCARVSAAPLFFLSISLEFRSLVGTIFVSFVFNACV